MLTYCQAITKSVNSIISNVQRVKFLYLESRNSRLYHINYLINKKKRGKEHSF